jgi:mannose-6-phosphate isomerase-like protein (cupin superfamily)
LSSSAGSLAGLSTISNSLRAPIRLLFQFNILPRETFGGLIGQ